MLGQICPWQFCHFLMMPFQRGKACVLPAPGPVGANRCLQASLTPSDKIFAFSDKETPPQGDIQSWYSPIQIPWLSLVLLKIINKPESSPSYYITWNYLHYFTCLFFVEPTLITVIEVIAFALFFLLNHVTETQWKGSPVQLWQQFFAAWIGRKLENKEMQEHCRKQTLI